MTRKDFIKNCAIAGIGSSFFATLFSSCHKGTIAFYKDIDVKFDGKILIIGAGAAGLTAGHILNKYNVDFQIIEASSVFGGRVKKTADFADFPIDLGGEWIHTEPSILAKLLNEPEVDKQIGIINYSPESIYLWHNNKLKKRNIFSNFYGEYKFKDTTWYGFFEQHIVPNISDKIVYNSPVNEINYSGDKVVVKDVNDNTFVADKVLVTVPIAILQNQFITFQPELPQEKIDALDSVNMPAGLKMFIEFSEKFYPDMTLIGNLRSYLREIDGDKIFYDAAFRKDTSNHVLGLFTVGNFAAEYTNLGSDEEIFNKVMSELDEMFDGKASATYKKHIIQNWSKEPFIQGSYTDFEEDEEATINTLLQPLDNKVYFAGEALNIDGMTATVHGAGESAYSVLGTILRS